MHDIGLRKHLELKLLNALTTVMVMDHEVMAVVANHSHPDEVDIVACTQSDAPIQQVNTETPRILGPLWELFISWNPRRSTPGDVPYVPCPPKICTPAIPDGLVAGDSDALLKYLDQRW